jgi:hypothetical protein
MDISVTVIFGSEIHGTSSPEDFSPFGDFSIFSQDMTSRQILSELPFVLSAIFTTADQQLQRPSESN